MSRDARTRLAVTLMAGVLLCGASAACQRANEDAMVPADRAVKASAGDTPGTDMRTPVAVDVATREAVLIEMRTMLKAVQGILGGAAAHDTVAIRTSASLAGMKAASEADPAVERMLGEDFVRLGMRTHAAFDSLADGVSREKNLDDTVRRLAGLMGNCVGCHEQWRLTIQPAATGVR